ncbi:MAG: protein kinase [Isosphaerales bacterium]
MTPMLPCPDREQLERLLADGLNGSEEHTVSVHIQQCGRCQQALEQLTQGPDGEKSQRPSAAPSETAAGKDNNVDSTHRSQASLEPKDAFINELKQIPRPLAGSACGELGGPDFATGSRPSRSSPAEAGPLLVIPGCEVLELLGRGGMGVVYRARQLALGRQVALKMIQIRGDSRYAARLRAEASALARLQHPNIVQIHELGEHDGQPFLLLEYLDGGTLRQRCGKPQGPRAAASLVQTLADAIHSAHERGITHRDLKPANVLLTRDGVPKITDFGLARLEALPAELGAGQSRTDFQSVPRGALPDALTTSGQILGTPHYMAPEQADRRLGQVGPAADVYALGTILYELLTGRPPFDGPTALDVVRRLLAEEALSPSRLQPGVPRDLVTICLHCLKKEPRKRYASALDLREDLRRFLAGEPIRARRVSAAERYWRWARHHPGIAVLGGVLTAVLVLATVASLLAAGRFNQVAQSERAARAAAQAETYRAMLSEVKALRAGHQLGWREEALANLARLLAMPTPRRDLVELRSEAVASIGEFGVEEVARLEASGNTVPWLDFSSDSRTLVTASDNGDLDFWDVPGRKHMRRLVGVSGTISSASSDKYAGYVRFLPDGDLAFLTASGRVSVLGANGRQSARPPIERGNARAVKLEVDRLGRWLAVGWNDGRIDLLDAGTGALRRSFGLTPGNFALSPDGKWLALQVKDGPVQLLPTSGQGPSITLERRGGYWPALAFSPDGATMASVMDHSLVLWDLALRQPLMSLGGHKESITAVAFSPDGALVATTCGDHMTRIWDARDGRALAVLPGPWFMRTLAFSPDGGYLVASAFPGPVCLYKLEGRQGQRRLVGHKFGVQCLAFHPHLPRFASGADDHAVIVWDADAARPLGRWNAHDIWVTGLAYSPDGSLLATTCGDSNAYNFPVDNSIRLWDAENGTLRKRLPRPPASGVRTLAFDPTGRRLASGDEGGTVLIWDVDSGKILRRENLGGSAVRSAVFVNGGRHLIVGQLGGKLALFDLEGSGPPRRTELPQGCVRLVVDSRGNRVIVGDSQGGLSTLSLPELTVVQRLANGHDGALLSLALRADGRLLATSGIDRRVVLRDALTSEALLTFPAETGLVKDVAFDASGRWLALAGADSDVTLWDLTRLHEDLQAAGLAWDQPAPAVVPAAGLAPDDERLRPSVPVIRPG